jgi:hypothetical protein
LLYHVHRWKWTVDGGSGQWRVDGGVWKMEVEDGRPSALLTKVSLKGPCA